MIRLIFFASLREAMGTSEMEMELPNGISTLNDLVDHLAKDHPQFVTRDKLRAAINEVRADWDAPIKNGDEVALFPPMTGG